MKINQKIKQRREELGISIDEITDQTGLDEEDFEDIETYADELITSTDLSEVRHLCEILNFKLLELFDLPPNFPLENEEDAKTWLNCTLPRHQLIEQRREELGLSQKQLAEQVGFYTVAVREMEKNPDFLESWSMEHIIELAETLKVPIEILLNGKPRKVA